MTNPHIVDVRLPMDGRGGRVLIDGVELRGVRSVSVTGAWDDLTTVTVTFLASVNPTPQQIRGEERL